MVFQQRRRALPEKARHFGHGALAEEGDALVLVLRHRPDSRVGGADEVDGQGPVQGNP
jgi:hypothetical protein